MVAESSLCNLGWTHILDNKFHKRLRFYNLNTTNQRFAHTNHIGANLSRIGDSAKHLLCIVAEEPSIQRDILLVDTVPLYTDLLLVLQILRCTSSSKRHHCPSRDSYLPGIRYLRILLHLAQSFCLQHSPRTTVVPCQLCMCYWYRYYSGTKEF